MRRNFAQLRFSPPLALDESPAASRLVAAPFSAKDLADHGGPSRVEGAMRDFVGATSMRNGANQLEARS